MKRTYITTLLIILGLILLTFVPAGAVTYEFDELNRITKVDYGNGMVMIYTYDSAGNVLSVKSQKTVPSLLVIQTIPVAGERSVSPNTPIQITFNEAIVAAEQFNAIYLRKGTSPVKIFPKVEGKTLQVETLESLQAGSEYHLFIPAGAVKGLLGSQINQDIFLSFRTIYNGSDGEDIQPAPDSLTPFASLKLEPGENYTRVSIPLSELQSRIDAGLKNITVDLKPSSGPLQILLSQEILQALNRAEVSLELQTPWGTLILPPGALSESEGIKLMLGPGAVTENNAVTSAGQAITIELQGESLNKPAVLSLDINARPQTDPASLFIYRLNQDGSLTCMGGEVKEKSIQLNRQAFSTYAVMEYTNSFNDLKNHWGKRTVLFLASRGIILGVDSRHFEPDRPVNRAEFTMMVTNCLGLKASESDPSFKDVSSTSWYASTVKAAYQAGLVKGTGDGCFHPERTISREEMAVLIMNAWSFKYKHSYSGDLIIYTDKESISLWARESVNRAGQIDIMRGNPDGNFRPHDQATRAEAAIVIGKLLQGD